MIQKLTLLATALLLCAPLSAQLIPNAYFQNFETKLCPWNPNVLLPQLTDWQVYQTQNDLWDGPVDSSRCFTAYDSLWWSVIPLDLMHQGRPLFIRQEIPAGLAPLQPDQSYDISTQFVGKGISIIYGDSCTNGLCSSAAFGVAIPDTSGQPFGALRWTEMSLNIGGCLVTEYFAEQELKHVIITLRFAPNTPLAGRRLLAGACDINQSWAVTLINEIPVPANWFINQKAEIPLSSITWAPGVLFEYTQEPSYPSAISPSYVEAFPVPNTTVVDTILVTVGPFVSAHFQPFTYLRGGLVSGDSSLRHIVILENSGFEMCLGFVDLVWDGGDAYRHAGGSLEFMSPFSCMQFRYGSSLQIASGATLHYGNEGAGMLALSHRGTIKFDPYSTLIFDGSLSIFEPDHNGLRHRIEVDLPKGAVWKFTGNARVSNQYTIDQNMKIHVRMSGGTIDLSALSDAEREVFVLEYPEPQPDFSENVVIRPNPVTETIRFDFLSADDQVLDWQLYNIHGALCQSGKVGVLRGWQTSDLPKAYLTNGVYFLRVADEKGQICSKKVVLAGN